MATNNIQQKDINDMYLSGHSVQNMVQSNVYQGLEANLRLNNWKNMSNGIKVRKRDGSVEPLNLDKSSQDGRGSM